MSLVVCVRFSRCSAAALGMCARRRVSCAVGVSCALGVRGALQVHWACGPALGVLRVRRVALLRWACCVFAALLRHECCVFVVCGTAAPALRGGCWVCCAVCVRSAMQLGWSCAVGVEYPVLCMRACLSCAYCSALAVHLCKRGAMRPGSSGQAGLRGQASLRYVRGAIMRGAVMYGMVIVACCGCVVWSCVVWS